MDECRSTSERVVVVVALSIQYQDDDDDKNDEDQDDGEGRVHALAIDVTSSPVLAEVLIVTLVLLCVATSRQKQRRW